MISIVYTTDFICQPHHESHLLGDLEAKPPSLQVSDYSDTVGSTGVEVGSCVGSGVGSSAKFWGQDSSCAGLIATGSVS